MIDADSPHAFDFGETVLEAHSVGKIYSRSQNETRRRIGMDLRRLLFDHRTSAGSADTLQAMEFWALKDVDLKLRRGEALGIIGLNGSGKTTLLRMLAGQIMPDAGEIKVSGRTASMIDLTAGFQTAASGRRNITLRSAALGRSQEEIAATSEEIIAFTELGDAIDAPVATYSSGMMMRLAFAILVAAEPDILFIDEVLAVGDFRFRQKCLTRIRELRERSAFIMVSHSMNDIARFCDKVVLLDQGKPLFLGKPEKGIELYHSLGEKEVNGADKVKTDIIPSCVYRKDLIENVEHYWCDAQGNRLENVTVGSKLLFRCEFKIRYKPRQLIVGIPIYNLGKELITGVSTDIDGPVLKLEADTKCVLQMSMDNVCLNPGIYQSAIGIVDGVEFIYMELNPPLNVLSSGKPYWGSVSLPHKWTLM